MALVKAIHWNMMVDVMVGDVMVGDVRAEALVSGMDYIVEIMKKGFLGIY